MVWSKRAIFILVWATFLSFKKWIKKTRGLALGCRDVWEWAAWTVSYAKRKGMEVSARWIPLILSPSHPFISWPSNVFLCWCHVFSPPSQRDSQTWEDWMKWETESSGLRGSTQMPWEQFKTLKGRKKTANQCLYSMLVNLHGLVCVCEWMFSISVKVAYRSAKEVQEQLPPSTEHLLQKG